MLSAFKNFLITFLVAALIFGIVGYFTAGFVSGIVSSILDGEKDHLEEIINNTPENTEKDDKPEDPDPDLKVPDGDSFTFVIIGTDYRPDIYKDYYHTYAELDELAGGYTDPGSTVGILGTSRRTVNATWIVLVRADKENREYVSCYISPETRVGTPSGDSTLGDVYGRYGTTVLCSYIEAMTRLEVDHSFVIDGINGIDFLSSMGSVKISVDSDIYAGTKYHMSASTSVLTHEIVVTDPPESTDESTNDTEAPNEGRDDDPKEEQKDDNKEDSASESAESEPEEILFETEIVDNVHVLDKGTQSLSDYSVHILNTFKELSADDITVKSTFVLDMVEGYLRRCADWSEEELTSKLEGLCAAKDYFGSTDEDDDTDNGTDGDNENDTLNGSFDDPFASKPILATDLNMDNIGNIHSMLEAIEYFEYSECVFPGSYSDEEKMFIPDTSSALEFFAKYDN